MKKKKERKLKREFKKNNKRFFIEFDQFEFSR